MSRFGDYKSSKFVSEYKSQAPRFGDYKSSKFVSEYKTQTVRFEHCNQDIKKPKQTIENKKKYNHRSPILCSEYIGIGSEKWHMSSENIGNTMAHIVDILSSEKYKSSDDIIKYLRSDPDFLRSSISNFEEILVLISSCIAVVGCVFITIVTYGGSIPIIGGVFISGLSNIGFIGLTNSVNAIFDNEKINWNELGEEIGIQFVTSIIPFVTGCVVGFASGYVVTSIGDKIRGRLMENMLARNIIRMRMEKITKIRKIVSLSSGSIAGAGVGIGSGVVKNGIINKPLSVFPIFLDGINGALSGCLGAKMFFVKRQKILAKINNIISYSNASGDIMKIGKFSLIKGYQKGNSGTGLIHIIHGHRDIFDLPYFNSVRGFVEGALRGNNRDLKKIADHIAKLLAEPADRCVEIIKGKIVGPAWSVGNNQYIRFTFSSKKFNDGLTTIIQANRMRLDKIPIPLFH